MVRAIKIYWLDIVFQLIVSIVLIKIGLLVFLAYAFLYILFTVLNCGLMLVEERSLLTLKLLVYFHAIHKKLGITGEDLIASKNAVKNDTPESVWRYIRNAVEERNLVDIDNDKIWIPIDKDSKEN